MLARARCDSVIRRTALSIPAEFLPRILLCSGLPATSVLTIIQKLGHIMETAHDRPAIFAKLLAPITLSGSKVGYRGNKRDMAVKRKMLARITAYFRIYEIPFPVANPFLASLLEEKDFSDHNETTKVPQKPIGRTGSDMPLIGTVNSATSLLSELSNFETFAVLEY